MAKNPVGKNLSSEFIGDQVTRFGNSTNIFSVGSTFNITTNLDSKLTKNFSGVLGNFSNPITLENVGLTSNTQNNILLNNNIQVFLNPDRRNINNFALFGSLKEFIRVSVENIIKTYPASIYVMNYVDGQIKNTVLNYTYDSSRDESTFDSPVTTFQNKFGITFSQNSLLFSTNNNLRNLSYNYNKFCITPVISALTEYNIIGLTGSTATTSGSINIKVKGNPFPTATGGSMSTTYHIKPRAIEVDNYFNGLDTFESYLLNRDIKPIFTSTFDTPLETDDGTYVIVDKKYTWPTSDGYNIDIDGVAYARYLEDILMLGKNQDDYKTNLISRFFTTDSLKEFDTVDGKVDKLLKIYGREFDEVKKYIDGIAYSTRVTYDKNENISDNLVKNLAKILGWGVLNSVSEDDILKSFLGTNSNLRFGGSSVNLTPVEADIELWRRIILNTAWLFKSKGTRKVIEFIFKFIGAPDSLINIEEYVYLVKQKLNPNQVAVSLSSLTNTVIIPQINENSAKGSIIVENVPFIIRNGVFSNNSGNVTNNQRISIGNQNNTIPTQYAASINVNGVIEGQVNTQISIDQNQDQNYANQVGAVLIANAINQQSLKYSAITNGNIVLINTLSGFGKLGNGLMNVIGNATFIFSGITGGTDGAPQQVIIPPSQSIENQPIDEFGFPRTLLENNNYYFQISGGWRSEIAISSSNDKNVGSTIGIHLGEYDKGQEYFKPFTNLGFVLNKIIDNKKSWTEYSSKTKNDYERRLTHYTADDSRLVLNSKEIGIFLDYAKAIEYDNYNYNKINFAPIASSGLTFPYPNTYLQQFDVNNISFAQYLDNIYKYFINAKNRKVITDGSGGGYPTLKKLYTDYYYNSYKNYGVQSSALDFSKISVYVEKIDGFWMEIIEQLLPATTIWEGGERYRNPIFNTQKFSYRQGINDGSEFQKAQIVDKTGTINISPDWSYARINKPQSGVNGTSANITDFIYSDATVRSNTTTKPNLPTVNTSVISLINTNNSNALKLPSVEIGGELSDNPLNTYVERVYQEGAYNLNTGVLSNFDSIFISNDILRLGKVYCGNTVTFTQPDFYVTAATKISTTPSVHNITTGGSKTLDFIFTANTSILTSSTATVFKYDLFKYVPAITGFTANSVYQKTVGYSVFSSQSATIKSYKDTSLSVTEGEYLIKASFLFTGNTVFPSNSGKTYDTYALNSPDFYTYNIYDANIDWYFVIQESPDKPKIIPQNATSISSTATTVTLTAVNEPLNSQTVARIGNPSNFQIQATINNDLEFKTEVINVLYEGQTGFTLSNTPVGDIMVNVNGNTLLASDNIGFTGSSGNGEYYLNDKFLYLANPLYLSGEPDTLSVYYLTGAGDRAFINEGLRVTGITTGNTTSYNGDKIFYNSGTSRYEYYLNQDLPISTDISVVLNGNKLTYGIDYYRSTSSNSRIILNGNISIDDTMFVYYLNPTTSGGPTTIGGATLSNAYFTATWNVKPTTNQGRFTVQIASQTDVTYSNVLYSGVTDYVSLSSSTAITVSRLIDSNTQQYNLGIGSITGVNQTYIYRVKSERYYTTISGGTLTAVTYSNNEYFKTDNRINSY